MPITRRMHLFEKLPVKLSAWVLGVVSVDVQIPLSAWLLCCSSETVSYIIRERLFLILLEDISDLSRFSRFMSCLLIISFSPLVISFDALNS